MAIMVKKLYKKGTFLYKMNLIAGRNGLNNLVQWVHIIEDDSVISFLHGNELVFTAGILNSHKDWLLNFAQKLNEAKVSAFVINIGPHTTEVPAEVIDYCNEVNMPLFTIPWETKMVDMTRDFCNRIINNDRKEDNLATTIKNIIFNTGDVQTQVLQMERYGFQKESSFCFVSMAICNADSVSVEEHKETLEIIAEKTAKSLHEAFVSFSYKENGLILVLMNFQDAEIEAFLHDFTSLTQSAVHGWDLHLGISSNETGIFKQSKNFVRAVSAMEIAIRMNMSLCYYEKMGIFKILYAVDDKEILKTFYADTIGRLEAYDGENATQYTHLLRTYLENNGSLQLVSEKLYIHRNTVTNQLNKIESITGFDPLNLEDRVQLYMGFYIKDIL